MSKYTTLKIARLPDFDGEKQFTILFGHEKYDPDIGYSFFPDSFAVGQVVNFISVDEMHLKSERGQKKNESSSSNNVSSDTIDHSL